MARLAEWANDPELAEWPIVGGRSGWFSPRSLLARSISNGELVVLRYLGGSAALESPATREDAEASLTRAAAIRAGHPGFAKLIAWRWTRSGLVTVNEYLSEAVSLKQLESLSAAEFVELAVGLCDALAYLHSLRSYHGDLHDGNIMVLGRRRGFLIDYDLADPVAGFTRSLSVINEQASAASCQLADVSGMELILRWVLSRVRSQDTSGELTAEEARTLRIKCESRLDGLRSSLTAPERLTAIGAILRDI